MELFLIRHGHTVVADRGEIAGHADVPLSKRGEAQVKALRESNDSLSVDAYHSSDLTRAIQSAELLGAEPIVVDARLRELNFGDWEGMTWDQVQQQYPDVLQHWSENWVERSPPGGESLSDLAERTASWLNDITSNSIDKSILVTAHAGSIKTLICQSLHLPLHHAMSFAVDHARVVKINLVAADQAGSLQCLNTDLASN